MEQYAEIYEIPAIALICYGFIELLKVTLPQNEKIKNFYPLISSFLGMLLGVILYLSDSNAFIDEGIMGAMVTGFVSGLSATGGNQIIKKISQKQRINENAELSPRYYITGDKHRNFKSVIKFCKRNGLGNNDVIVILGDSCFNYYSDHRDHELKARVNSLGVKILSIHGNKENRPQNISTYGKQTFLGGTVYYEPKYPNLLFAKDGEVYNFNGKEYMVIGGAHSVDKQRCLLENLPYWEDEIPTDAIKADVELRLSQMENKIYGFLTHTCPYSCIPTEMFVSTQRESSTMNLEKKEYELDIDRSTEEWLEKLKNGTNFCKWYCGHFHIDKEFDGIKMMKNEILPFCTDGEN